MLCGDSSLSVTTCN
nr:hypothetical protein [Streptomyces viridosporus]